MSGGLLLVLSVCRLYEPLVVRICAFESACVDMFYDLTIGPIKDRLKSIQNRYRGKRTDTCVCLYNTAVSATNERVHLDILCGYITYSSLLACHKLIAAGKSLLKLPECYSVAI